MKNLKMDDSNQQKVLEALKQSELLGGLSKNALQQVAQHSQLIQYEPEEIIVKENDPSDSFFMIIQGEVSVQVQMGSGEDYLELSVLKPYSVIGEMGVLLEEPRSATVKSIDSTLMLRFEESLFKKLHEQVPSFGLALSKSLARSLKRSSKRIPLAVSKEEMYRPSPEAIKILPMELITRHRILPLSLQGKTLRIGFVEDPTAHVLDAVRRFAAGLELEPVQIDARAFDEFLQSMAGVEEWQSPAVDYQEPEPETETTRSLSPKLDTLLKRMVAEGASDIHLSAREKPRWRIDGDLRPIEDISPLGGDEVLDLMRPLMQEHIRQEFEEKQEVDFAYHFSGASRFRVNIFRDYKGVGAVLRLIPSNILSFEQLGLPPIVRSLCDQPKGLVLVTGPTGSGKSTTLASMIDYINKTRQSHIITLEDPIEFVYSSEKCLINQREVGSHTKSFASALRAGLREDPDIVLVGEMRDLETISLALETAYTGHLVFATLHTATAIGTIDRIIGSFPPDEQGQVRASLCETLLGVVSQTLCKRIGGGRIAALEVMVVDTAVANLIREEKMNQILSQMQTQKAKGNQLLNEHLANLVKQGKVDFMEALSKTPDKNDLANRVGKKIPE